MNHRSIFTALILTCLFPLGLMAQADSLLRLLHKAGNTEARVDLSIELGKFYRNSKPDSAIFYCNEALKMIRQSGLKGYLPECLSYIGLSYRTKAEYNTALEYFKEALRIAADERDTTQMAYSHNNIGGIYRLKSIYIQALNHISEARALFGAIGNQEGMVFCNVNLAVLYRYQGDLEKSYPYLEEAIKFRRESGDIRGLATAYSLMAENLFIDKRYDEALDFYYKAWDIYGKKGGSFEKAANLNGIAGALLETGKISLALQYRLEALELAESINDADQTVRALTGAALVRSKLGQHNEAEELVNRAIALAASKNLESRILEAWMARSEIAANAGNYQDAFEFLKKHTLVRDTIFNAEKSRQLQELQTVFETNQQEEMLNNQAKALQTEQIRNAWLLAGIGLTLAIIIILIFYFRNKTRLYKLLKAEKELAEKQKEQLTAMNETNKKLFTIIAHDLRSPFQGLLGLSEIIRDESKDHCEEKISALASRLNQSANAAHSLVENLLDWSKIQFGQLEVRTGEIDVNELIDHTMLLFSVPASEKNLHVTKDIKGRPLLNSDSNLLAAILRNLVSNAVKFTPEHGQIKLSVTAAESATVIKVSDSGIGMTSEQIDRLSNNKLLNSSAGTRNEKGSGLGLSICRDFTKMIGGTFEVESTPGHGTTFTITIP